MQLITTGRRSGLPRPVELSFAHRDGRLYLLGHRRSQWVRNLRAHPKAEAHVGSLHLSVEALFPEDAEEILTLARQLFTAKYGADYVRSWYEGTPRWPIVLTIRSWAKG